MIELYDGLRTCEDVRSLGTRGVGEGPRMDYKEALALTGRGTLTAGAKKELARDVCAFANAEGGLLVVGVKDPAGEGDAPAPEDFVGVAVTDTFARDLESVLLDAMSPPFYPSVKATDDDFEDPGSRERRRFVLVGVRRSPRLLQVTAGGDLRFYRRAGYQNRPMDAGEVRLRIAAETAAGAEADGLLRAEAERIGRVFGGGPRVAFVAVPTVPHRFAVEPASWEARNRFQQFAGRQPPRHAPPGVDILSPGFDSSQAFVPAGDGARSFYRITNPDVTAEVRVRRDGLVSSARDGVELYSQPAEYLWLRKPQPWHEIFVPVPEEEFGPGMMEEALRRAGHGQPSTVAGLTPAVRLDTPWLLASARGFLLFAHQAHELLGYPGPVRVEVRVSGGDRYLAVAAPSAGVGRQFFFVSEQTELRSSVEAERQDLVTREAELAQDLLARLTWHFGTESFDQ